MTESFTRHIMKLRFVIIVAFLYLSGASWSAPFVDPLNRPAPMAGELRTVSRLTTIARAGERLVAAGAHGLILVSNDSGKRWQQVPSPISSDLFGLFFLNAKKGWAVGQDGVILHTSDGGLNWVVQIDGKQVAALVSSYFGKVNVERPGSIDQKTLEDAERIARGGAAMAFFAVAFLSEAEGFAVGSFNIALRTSDGGRSWLPIIDRTSNPEGLHLYALAVTAGDLFLAGEAGLIRQWDQASGRFRPIMSPDRGSIFGLLSDEGLLYAFGLQGAAFYSRDLGAHWNKIQGLGMSSVNDAALMADHSVVFATQDGRLFRLRTGSESVSEINKKSSSSYSSVEMAAPGTVAIVGPRGVSLQPID